MLTLTIYTHDDKPLVSFKAPGKIEGKDLVVNFGSMPLAVTGIARKLELSDERGWLFRGSVGMNGFNDLNVNNVFFTSGQIMTMTNFRINNGAHLVSLQRRVETSPCYPHKCPRCGAAAYVGFSTVDCSSKCGVRLP